MRLARNLVADSFSHIQLFHFFSFPPISNMRFARNLVAASFSRIQLFHFFSFPPIFNMRLAPNLVAASFSRIQLFRFFSLFLPYPIWGLCAISLLLLFLTFSHFVFFLFFLIFNIKFVSSPLLIHSPVSMYLFYLASFSYPIWSLRQSSCLSILLHSRLSLALLHSYIAYEIELTYSLIHFLVFSHFFFPVFLFLDLVWNLWQSRCLFVLSHEGDCDNENLLASNAMNHDCCQPASVYINLTNWYNLSHFDQHPTTKNSCSSPISINIQ